VREALLERLGRVGRGVPEFQLNVSADAGAVDVADDFSERPRIKGLDALVGRQQPHGIGASQSSDRLEGDAR
jgi:hypothetical protein